MCKNTDCNRFRLTEWDYYFWVTVDHFWSRHHNFEAAGLESKNNPPLVKLVQIRDTLCSTSQSENLIGVRIYLFFYVFPYIFFYIHLTEFVIIALIYVITSPGQYFDFSQGPLAIRLMLKRRNLLDGNLCLSLIVQSRPVKICFTQNIFGWNGKLLKPG